MWQPLTKAAGCGARQHQNGHEELEHGPTATVGCRAADVHEARLA